MFGLEGGWNISFAGCGFLGVYHIGVASCLLEVAPHLIRDANKIYGASAGALTAAAIVSRACLAQCCEDVMEVAKEARKRNLGPLHPSFNMVKILRSGLHRALPHDAHLLASGRLCVSLTRVSDGQNVLVSDFSSKAVSLQALICSCFVPIYCGLIPPLFRGVRYVDGGISNNLPQYELKNTITISPFSGESDICPRDNSTNFHELRVTNTSIQFSLDNLYRLTRALFPPEPKILAEMCQSGYKDALRFLKENIWLLCVNCHPREIRRPGGSSQGGGGNSGQACVSVMKLERCTWKLALMSERFVLLGQTLFLSPHLSTVFFEACEERKGLYAQLTSLLPMRVASYVLMPYTLPVESAYSVALRLVEWLPELSDDVRWMCHLAGSVYRRAWGRAAPDAPSRTPLRKCMSLPPAMETQRPGLGLRGNPHLSSAELEAWYWGLPGSPLGGTEVQPSALLCC
uniref:triacylglycerol lipase n=1 Tax=Lepisosteus oculatus TaxID=7918 RepID=W5ND55_LEPOC